MYTRILVGTDLSEDADRALASGSALAKRDGAKLAACHVVPNLQPVSMLFPQAVQFGSLAVADLERRAGEVLADRVCSVTGLEGDAVELFVETGNDYAALVSRAEEWKADLVIVASHGHTGMKRALIGSVSDRVVRHAHCSVRIERPGDRKGPVVAASDLSEASMPAVVAAAAEAKALGAELVVLHVVDTLPIVAGHAMGTPLGLYGVGLDAQAAAALVSTAQATLSTMLESKKIVAKSEAIEGSAASAIVSRADALDARLLVIATHGRTGLRRALLGSVAESVVRHAPCNTLVVRQ